MCHVTAPPPIIVLNQQSGECECIGCKGPLFARMVMLCIQPARLSLKYYASMVSVASNHV